MPNKPVMSSRQSLWNSVLEKRNTESSLDKPVDASNSNSHSMSYNSYRADIVEAKLEIEYKIKR